MTFQELGLSDEILTAIARLGFETPTPVQAQVIPRLLDNKGDVVALAQTGTGKTAAFGLPILTMLDHSHRAPQALVLCPTRELCMQIARDMEAFAACSPSVNIVAVYGGAPIQTQLRALDRGVQIIVATPGRMLDILRRGKADLSGVERVILDEADEMLNMGFQEELEAILTQVPKSAHTLLFSATMPRHVANIAKNYMSEPEEITVGQRNVGAETVSHQCYIVQQRDRYLALKRIADFYPDMYAIVFCRTRVDTQNVADWLIRDGYSADALHGDLTQVQRDRVMTKFREGGLRLLVATDVAARGLDVNDLTHVINYNMPEDLGSYTHRSGRTGRAGKTGISILIINMREKGKAQRIEKTIGKRFEYCDVPSPRNICETQLVRLIARMKDVEVNRKEIEPYLPAIFESLAGMAWEEVITRFVSLEFNTLFKYYRDAQQLRSGDERPSREGADHKRNDRSSDDRSDSDSRASRDRKSQKPRDVVRMFVNIGRLDGINPQKLMALISREGGHNIPIGRVEIMRKYAFFDIASSDVDAIVLSLGMAEYNGRAVRVDPVDDRQRDKGLKRHERPTEPGRDKKHKAAHHTKGAKHTPTPDDLKKRPKPKRSFGKNK